MKFNNIINLILTITMYASGIIGAFLIFGSARPFELDEITCFQFIVREFIGFACCGICYLTYLGRAFFRQTIFYKNKR